MVLCIGTGNPIGFSGGLFHMLNNAIYKSCLFFSGGGVEKRAGTTELERLGGLAKEMPVTFLTFMTASLAISGIPPLNGFVSKWMVYQGIIETAKTGGRLWIIWLLSAMFGSALTLASFMKLIHAVFLGQPDKARAKGYAGRTNWFMLIPQIALAILCVIFGIFAGSLPLRYLIFPCLKTEVIFTGVWDSAAAAMLLLGGIILGLLIYLLAGIKIRSTDTFVGGETAKDFPDMRVSGTQFYDTIKDIKFLRGVYILAEKKAFDIYEQAKNAVFAAGGFLRYLHNGVLPTYLVWTLLGMMGIFLFLHR
jgi:NADH:ubiquinone oxidoreductase subunit 5 (subunit L)/multisubunit Na+/H+ antiporter MnhA subunit